jgi:two-component system NtrC family sensor kinase
MENGLQAELVQAHELFLGHFKTEMDHSDTINAFKAAAADVDTEHDRAAAFVDSAEEQAWFDECHSLHDQASAMFLNQVVPMADTPGAELNPVETDLHSLYERMFKLRTQIEASYTADQERSVLSQMQSREASSELGWTASLLAIAAGLMVAGLSGRRLLKPVLGMADAAREMSRGDMSRRVKVEGRDELAEMGNAFNFMAESLERRTNQLEDEKSRMRSIHQSIGDGILVVDRAGVIISANPAAEVALEKTAVELERSVDTGVPALQEQLAARMDPAAMVKCWKTKNCNKPDCPSYQSEDRRCWLQCGTHCHNQIQGTFRQKRDACERCNVFHHNAVRELEVEIGERHFSVEIVPILDDEGQEGGRTVVMHDITELQRANQELKRHSAEVAAINSVSEAVSKSLDLETILQNALDRIIELTSADGAAVSLLNDSGDYLEMLAEKGFPEGMKSTFGSIPSGTGLAGEVINTGKPALTNDAREDERVRPEAREAGLLSIMIVPLKSKGSVMGIIVLTAFRAGAYTEDDSHMMTLIANQVAVAIENSSLYEDSLRHSREVLAKNRIVSTLTSAVEVEKVFDEFADQIRLLVDFKRISVVVTEADQSAMKVIVPTGHEPALDELPGGMRPVMGTAVEWVVKNQRPFIGRDIRHESRFREQAKFIEEGLRSQLNIPLIVKGEVVGSLNFVSAGVGSYDDNTVRKLQPVADQLALAVANQKLFENVAQAKSEWEKTFDSASEGIAMVGVNHRILRINRAAAEMMAGEVGDFLGRRCFEVLHAGGSKPAHCLMDEAVSGASSTRAEQEMSDGRTLELVVDPVFDSEGKPSGAVHFLRDITEAKRLREQLLQSEKMVAVGQLVSGVAHEINNPLTGVVGYAQLLLSQDIGEKAKKDAEGIYREAERATRIVRHLLSFARKHQPERNLVDMNAVLKQSLELKAYDLRVNNIAVETELDDGIPQTNADPHQLQQVFLNLITNAEQAMLEEKGSGKLRVSSGRKDGKIIMTFADDGPGVPEEIRGRIFDPFYTTKDVGKGTGLGLSVCFGVVTDHGGSIRAETTPGGGATMLIELPVTSPETVIKAETHPEFPQANLGKILLVDDEEAIREVLTKTLESVGHTVETAQDGEAALGMLKEKHYDCVVSDVKMPVMDGPMLHRAIQGLDPDLARHFIFISGDTVNPETESYLSMVDNPHLTKPFKLEDLETLLQQVLAAEKR